ncbi:MAG: hypothetical protein JXB36_15800, partial [Gammaproteobacteria bacterium]|nr:hypothetical protein [Gammaproteobacteria bacterium]
MRSSVLSTCLFVSAFLPGPAAAPQPVSDEALVSVGRGAPASPKLPYPSGEAGQLGDFFDDFAVVGPFRIEVDEPDGKPRIVDIG